MCTSLECHRSDGQTLTVLVPGLMFPLQPAFEIAQHRSVTLTAREIATRFWEPLCNHTARTAQQSLEGDVHGIYSISMISPSTAYQYAQLAHTCSTGIQHY